MGVSLLLVLVVSVKVRLICAICVGINWIRIMVDINVNLEANRSLLLGEDLIIEDILLEGKEGILGFLGGLWIDFIKDD